jgi:polysaccharide export outer membrane protein
MRNSFGILVTLAASVAGGAPLLAQPLPPSPSAMDASMPAPPMRPSDGYVLGINDEVEVTIFTVPQNIAVKTKIKEDGTISLPFLGFVRARDRTARQLASEIAELLRRGGYFTRPVVNVDVTQYVSNVVTVFGDVSSAGVFPLDRPMTVGMMIARAGGTRGAAAADFVILRREGETEEHRIQLAQLSGEWSTATPLRAGDTLYVPAAPLLYVYGQINTAGAVPILSGMTVRQALARSGGPTVGGSEKNITIYRGGQKLKRVKLDELVQPGDIMFIHERLF